MSKTILVSGGAGYIGSVLTASLLDEGYSVRVLDRCFFGQEPLRQHFANPRFSLINEDIRFVKQDVFRGVDVVCELAGLSNDPSCDLDPALTLDINYKGPLRVARLAKQCGTKRFIFSSSCSVYGSGAARHLTEESAKNPVSYYAKLKCRAEKELEKLDDKDFSVTFLRPATAYGISGRMRFDLVINMMTLYAVKKGKIYIVGGGKQWRPIVHLTDIAKAFLLAIEAPLNKVKKEAFNVGSNEQNFQVRQIADTIKGLMPEVIIEVAPDDPDKRSYHVNFDKIRKVLGFRVRKNPVDGIREVRDALIQGSVTDGIITRTVDYYKHLLGKKDIFKRDLTVNRDGKKR